jgi:hypothetical protein
MRAPRLVLLAVLACAGAVPSHAAPVTLRFSGTADLSAFGAPATSVFAGSIFWDTAMEPESGNRWYARYLLDGDPSSVRATLKINGVDYSDRIQPFSRLEIDHVSLFADLYFFFDALDLDNGPGPDIHVASIDFWTNDWQQVLFPPELPPDVSALSKMNRRFGFRHDDDDWEDSEKNVYVVADTLTVPEPSVLALLLTAIGVSVRRARRRDAR